MVLVNCETVTKKSSGSAAKSMILSSEDYEVEKSELGDEKTENLSSYIAGTAPICLPQCKIQSFVEANVAVLAGILLRFKNPRRLLLSA